MKIKTITCHDVYNCGASLQAYALQRFLCNMGHDVEIIDYKPDYLNYHYKWHWYVNENSNYYARCRNSVIYRGLYVTQRYLRSFATYKRRRQFDEFTRKHLSLTRNYNDYKNLCQEPPSADVYIVGSDQVWNNAVLNNGWDPAFFLSFGEAKIKRISYAASFGTEKSRIHYITKHHLSLIDAISVREESGKRLLSEAGFDSHIVCDPVFLLKKEEWQELCAKQNSTEPYVLIYNLGKMNRDLIRHAQSLKKERGLKVYVVKTSASLIKADKVIKDVGPIEFITLIANASIVLSNSFHATAFSVIFEKDFYTYPFQNMEASQRMINILKRLNLMSRFNPGEIRNMELNYRDIVDAYETMIHGSKSWLSQQIPE